MLFVGVYVVMFIMLNNFLGARSLLSSLYYFTRTRDGLPSVALPRCITDGVMVR